MRAFIVSIIFIFCFLTTSCSYHLIKIPTGGMQPTVSINAKALTDESAYSEGHPVNRFDIVIHKAPVDDNFRRLGMDENTRFIHRIIGLNNEKVEIRSGKVFINDKLLDEPFSKIEAQDSFGPIIVPENEFFLLGDNRSGSNDSRYWRPSTIKREDILGKVVRIF